MSFILWGHKDRSDIDAVTRDADYSCLKCPYRGRLLLMKTMRKTHIYFIPVTQWRQAEGIMVCPLCGNRSYLSKRKYEALPKFDNGGELVLGMDEIEANLRATRNRIASKANALEVREVRPELPRPDQP